MRLIVLWILCVFYVNAANSNHYMWEKNATFLQFLDKYNISSELYYSLYGEDKELVGEISAGVRYYLLEGEERELLQALIPLNEYTQIHIYKKNTGENTRKNEANTQTNPHNGFNGGSKDYKIDFIPIKYFSYEKTLGLKVVNSPYADLINETNDLGLAGEFVRIYKNSINFKTSIIKGDHLAIIYSTKERLGLNIGIPEIKAALMQTNKKPNFIFAFKDGRYYNTDGKEVVGFSILTPVPNARISSKFSLSRLHPILKIRRPHYGVDYAAPIGTKVYAAASGKVIFTGVKGGYGDTIEITHIDGLKSLYGHLKSFDVKRGQYVKRGQVIGRIGTSGLSTGPHLHFGLYKNNKPINPLLSIKTTQNIIKKEDKKDFNMLKVLLTDRLNALIEDI